MKVKETFLSSVNCEEYYTISLGNGKAEQNQET